MNLRYRRIDKSLPEPAYQTEGAIAFDLYARKRVSICAGGIAKVPVNLVVEVPEGYALILASRSSTPLRLGLQVANSIGVVDQDFNGPDDEIAVLMHNISEGWAQVNRGERIAQAFLLPVPRVELVEESVLYFAEKSRGGFGSTGSGV